MATRPTLVLSATGKTGRRIVPRLRLRGVPVRAASRTASVPFDWYDPTSWEAALADVEAVYVVAPTTPGPVGTFVDRAEAAGVRRLVLLSGRSADDWAGSGFGDDMRDAEDAVRASSSEWTVLRPTNFFQNFSEEAHLAPLLAGDLALPAGTLTDPMVDIDDLADVATRVLTEPGQHGGRTYELTGPRPLTYREAADIIARATDRAITYSEVSPEHYTASLVGQGVEEDVARAVAAMYALIERGVLAATTDGVREVLGRAPRTFEDYVAREAAAGTWRR
ncbi:NmrA family protein (plasmid) [Pseudonocardia sp. EC080625-04]|uniref:NAD(P)H-binding protein n=1 Tax=Pseudonocardia sp. EC080625-04 TaxID=1096868 RepID=UPI0006CB3457|nr:NAD(P)H-binding protein [Pseudonocardia sp. EC080625-04]ALE76826.1 NmrA family protein [Pseudonocardia sp. EC080625-04]